MRVEQTRPLLYLLLGLASVFVIIFGIRASAAILNPILLAMVITVTVLPLPGALTRRGLPGWLAYTVSVLAVVGALALVVVVFFAGIAQLSARLSEYGAEIAEQTTTLSTWFESNVGRSLPINGSQITSAAAAVVGLLVGTVVQIGMTLLIFVFMLSAAIALPRVASGDGLGPDNPVFQRVSELTRDVRQYVTITTGINFVVGVGNTVFLWIMGVDFAVLWGLLSWLLGYIPSIGFWLAAIPPVILAWATNGATSAIVVFIGFVLINGTAENLIKPKVMGEGLSISPVLVLVSVIVWGWLLGGIGAIIAVPLTLLILSVLESYEGASWFMVLLRPAPAGTEHDSDRREAMDRVRNLWGRVTDSFRDDEKRDAAGGATADAAAGAAESDGEPLI